MADVSIPDVLDGARPAVDPQAARAGVSRNERGTTNDLQRFSRTSADLIDPDVMDQAWTRSRQAPVPTGFDLGLRSA